MARFANDVKSEKATRFAAEEQMYGDCSSRNNYTSSEGSASPDSIIIIGTDNKTPRSNAMLLKNLRDRGDRKRQRSPSPSKVNGANKRRSHGHTPVKSETDGIGNQLPGQPSILPAETRDIGQDIRGHSRRLHAPASLVSTTSNANPTKNNANDARRNANNNLNPSSKANSRFSTSISSPPKASGKHVFIRGATEQPGVSLDGQHDRQSQHQSGALQDYNKHGKTRREQASGALLYSRPDQRAITTHPVPVRQANHKNARSDRLTNSSVRAINEVETNRGRAGAANVGSNRAGRADDDYRSRLHQQVAPVSIKGRGAFRYHGEDTIAYNVSANADRLSDTSDYDSAVGIPTYIEDLKEANRRLVNEVHDLKQKIQAVQTDASDADHAAKEAGIEARAAERAASEAKMDALDAKTKLSIVEARLENRIVELERVMGGSRAQNQASSHPRNNSNWGQAMTFHQQITPYGRSSQKHIRRQ